MTKLSSFIVALTVATVSVEAFTSPFQTTSAFSRHVHLFEEKDAAEAVFVPPADEDIDEDMMFEKAELLGRGSSKVRLVMLSHLFIYIYICESLFLFVSRFTHSPHSDCNCN